MHAQVKGYIELARQEGCTILCGDGVEELQLPENLKNVSKVHWLQAVSPFYGNQAVFSLLLGYKVERDREFSLLVSRHFLSSYLVNYVSTGNSQVTSTLPTS